MNINEQKIEIAGQLGMSFDRINEDGEPEFIGNEEQFKNYQKQLEMIEKEIVDEEAEDANYREDIAYAEECERDKDEVYNNSRGV